MSRRVYLTGPARRDLKRLAPDVRDRIMAGIRRFAETGHGDVRKLTDSEGLRRLRVGDWRIIYRTREENSIEVQAIVHRGKGYRAREDIAAYGRQESTHDEAAIPAAMIETL